MPKPDGKRTQLSETAGRANILMFTLLRRSKVMRTRTQVSQGQKQLQLSVFKHMAGAQDLATSNAKEKALLAMVLRHSNMWR